MNKERIDRLVEEKKEKLPQGVWIIAPEDGLSAETQSDWLAALLSRMYVQHGITKNRERLLADIASGVCRPWFAVRGEQAVASAALIQQNDGSVEIGRAVSLENGIGGLLMLSAVAEHLNGSTGPIVAEVRISDQFLGIPSGEATQTICFRHLDLNPHALVPAFHHGEPNRQEMFLFSCSDKIDQREAVVLPDDKACIDLVVRTAMALTISTFRDVLELETTREIQSSSGWEIVFREPFNLVVPRERGSKLEVVMAANETGSPFTLMPISADTGHAGAIIDCLNLGFVPCGFDRNPDNNGHPVLLFGKLRNSILLAPIKIVSELFSSRVVGAINSIDKEFRHPCS